MQRSISVEHHGQRLRGMIHMPEGRDKNVPAAVLFHGFTGTKLEPHRIFLKISRALEAIGVASFRFDFLGSGESDGNFEDMTLSGELAEAETILRMVRRYPGVDPAQVSLIGLSMGGLVASLLAGEYADWIKRLILMAPAGNIEQVVLQAAGTALMDENTQSYDFEGDLVGRAFADDLRELRAFERAKTYSGPVLLLHGSNDPTVPVQVSKQYATTYGTRASLRIIEGADHTFNGFAWEQEVIQAIVQYMEQQ